MEISIKTKFLALCVFLVLLTTGGISVTYYWLTKQDKQWESRQRIRIAFDIILDDFVNRRASYTRGLEGFLEENVPLSRATYFYSRDESQIGSMEFILIHFSQVAEDLKKFGRTILANRLTLYGINKRLLLSYQRYDDVEDVGIYRISHTGEDSYLSLNSPSDRSQILFSNQSIPDAPLPVGVAAHFEGEIPETITAELINDGQRLSLKIIAPVYRYESIVGVFVCEVFSTQPIVERYASLSKTEVNLFTEGVLSVGTLYEQTQFVLKDPEKIASCETLLTPDAKFDIVPVTFNEQNYYQGQCVIKNDEALIGAITVSLSQEIEQQGLRKILTAVLGISGITVILAFCLSWIFSQSIIRTIRDVALTAEMIAEGNLTRTVKAQGSGEIRRLSQAFNHMADNLRTITGHVKRAGNCITSSTQKISGTTDHLAASLEEQSASVLQTSLTMEMVAAASQQIAKSIESVVNIAEKTRTDAQHGMHVAEDMIKKMQDIERSNRADTENIHFLGQQSTEIAKIMEVIASIADQTKLIAFNASLEAAGAGRAGKRFGVVAGEIRHLADNVIGSTGTIHRTLTAMQQAIRKLVLSSEISTRSIREGVEYTTNTATWLKEILNGTVETTRAAQEISRSTQQLQLASEEISVALKEISINTTHFVEAGALSRDTASQLKSLAEDLEKVIEVFKL